MAAKLYLDLLKKSLTNTLLHEEPSRDESPQFIYQFIQHYIAGNAITMLPVTRLDNIQDSIIDLLKRRIPGDLIETGVWRGGAAIFMRAVLKAYEVTDRQVWVADSFAGLPAPDAALFPNEAKFQSAPLVRNIYKNFAVDLETVKRNFASYGLLDDSVRFLEGWFKDTLPAAPIERLAMMRLDGDFYESTVDALTGLYDKLSVGGYVIIDDYGEDNWNYCRRAVDEFRADRRIADPLVRVDDKCCYWQRAS
jgi:macrocin-O-methyltransferase TylF-like protien